MSSDSLRQSRPFLEMRDIVKSFPGVKALKGVSLTLNTGEVLALIGENGAGKSTLMKTLGGIHQPDSGFIAIEDSQVNLNSPAASQAMGIALIHQEFSLAPNLSAADNIFLGKERGRFGLLDRKSEVAKADELFDLLGIRIDSQSPCSELTVAEQQSVEIARALSSDARIIVMDEPTAALSQQETQALMRIVRELRRKGIAIVYISHRLEEVFELANRVTVLRDGETVGECGIEETSKGQLIEWMVGRPLNEEFPERDAKIGSVCLTAENLSREGSVDGVSFQLRSGEVLGIAGLVGSGRTELARLLFGADRSDSGTIRLRGEAVDVGQPADAIGSGICLLTEDRKSQGLILIHSALENFGLPNLKEFGKGVFINHEAEQSAFRGYASSLKIKLSDPLQRVGNLSGGNQQKVVIAKWLQNSADVFIFDEPTRGIDVGAKYEIYLLINQLVGEGKSVILISSELPEVMGMSDRILVMKEGQVCGEIPEAKKATQESVMRMALGADN